MSVRAHLSTTDTRASRAPSIDIETALATVRRFLPPTPLVRAWSLGSNVHLKLESLQPTGSFKVRGALAALSRLPAGDRVVTVSAGNHALGIAYAAQRLGIEAVVVLPETASPAKLQALKRYPARVIVHGATYEEARARAEDLAADGWHYVSPFNDPDVVAGQATVGVEIFKALGQPAVLVCPVGGGGLASGLALAARGQPRSHVLGVEAEKSKTMRAALDAGRIVPIQTSKTIADGITGNLEKDSITFDIFRECAVELVAVDDSEIEAAIRLLAKNEGIVAEGASATTVAALQSALVPESTGPIALIITGRNIDPLELSRVLQDAS